MPRLTHQGSFRVRAGLSLPLLAGPGSKRIVALPPLEVDGRGGTHVALSHVALHLLEVDANMSTPLLPPGRLGDGLLPGEARLLLDLLRHRCLVLLLVGPMLLLTELRLETLGRLLLVVVADLGAQVVLRGGVSFLVWDLVFC